MRLRNLHIKNIGPFHEAWLDFPSDFPLDAEGHQPVTIITGMNGTGKSILIDAVRAAFSGGKALGRNIVADENDFLIEMELEYGSVKQRVSTSSMRDGYVKAAVDPAMSNILLWGYDGSAKVHDWLIDYWSANSPVDSFRIQNMTNIEHRNLMKGVMSGRKSNVDLVNFICHTDYLRTSEMPEEKELGKVLYGKLKDIIRMCLDEGVFKYVRRSDLTPIVEQNGVELSLEKLSSGNLFLLEHLLLLLCKMYSVAVLCKLKPADITSIPGLLLIDEIETHLHPKWQKKILGIVRRLFPNLQIILTTHSPFVVASIEGARIYTCVPRTGYSEVCDETEKYDQMPVEEVLMSDAFGEVHPFNDEITALMHQRKRLIEAGEKAEARKLAKKLYEINPEYFSYLQFTGGF